MQASSRPLPANPPYVVHQLCAQQEAHVLYHCGAWQMLVHACAFMLVHEMDGMCMHPRGPCMRIRKRVFPWVGLVGHPVPPHCCVVQNKNRVTGSGHACVSSASISCSAAAGLIARVFSSPQHPVEPCMCPQPLQCAGCEESSSVGLVICLLTCSAPSSSRLRLLSFCRSCA